MRASRMLLAAALLTLSWTLPPLVAAAAHRRARASAHALHPSAPQPSPAAGAMPTNAAEAGAVQAMQQWSAPRASSEPAARTASTLSWTHGMNSYTMARPEGERSYLMYVPFSYDGTKAVSYVQALHGLTDSAANFASWTRVVENADVWGYVAVIPQGFTGSIGTGWNAGRCCVGPRWGGIDIDDVAFLSAVLGNVQATLRIRGESIHSVGFSNGGFMSERLACQAGSVWRSVSSVAGITELEPGNAEGLAVCDGLYRSASNILHVHGTADPTVPWMGDASKGFPSVPDDIAAWVKRNGCSGAPVQTFRWGACHNQWWHSCANGDTQVELVINDGGGHTYPMIPNGGFHATDYSLRFFNRTTQGGLGAR